MREKFQQELKNLNDDIIKMGTLIENSLGKIKTMLKNPSEKTADEILSNEKQVDQLEREIQSRCLHMLFSQQPVARDLRCISTALNIITDMERISDQAFDISDIIIQFKGKKMLKEPVHISEMIEKCISMTKHSIDSFVMQSIEIAQSVIDADDEVDSLFLHVRDEIVDLINDSKANGEQAVDFVMIAKYLERIADHAVNVAEWVIFNITGEHKNNKLI